MRTDNNGLGTSPPSHSTVAGAALASVALAGDGHAPVQAPNPINYCSVPTAAVIYAHAGDGDKRQLSWIGDNVQALLGYTAEECLAPGWWQERVHADDRDRALAGWSSVAQDGRLGCEYRFRTSEGHYRWLRDEARLIRDSAGDPLYCVGSLTELTERHDAGTALAESETQYREVVEASTQGIGIVQGGLVRYANPTMARMFGYHGPHELVGAPWESLAAAEDHAVLRARIEACVRGQAVDLHPGWQGVRKDGTHLWVESIASPIAWNGQPAVLSMILDITQRKRLEEQFRQSQKMEAIGRLAGGVAHDFNNLLTVIIGYSDIVRAALPKADPLHSSLEQIQKAGERAALLTRQLLVFSRKQVLRPVTTDLNALLADMEKMLVRLIGEDIDLRVTSGASLWKVRVDPGQLEQVVMNLVVNARDAMPRGGKLTIETANVVLGDPAADYRAQVPSRDYALLAVSDTGCGMDEAVQARVFEPFFTTKGPDQGSGLGLATVYGIVQQSGGRIAVYSEVGVGTAFKIYLPRDPAGSVSDLPLSSPAKPDCGSETVLLVEDDEQVRALARLVLRSHGYSVIEACDGDEALRLCAQHAGAIDLMVTDIVMPRVNGRLLAERVQALRPALRVLFLSGYTDAAVVHHGVLGRGAAFLQKPFAPEALARKVRAMLDSDEPNRGERRGVSPT